MLSPRFATVIVMFTMFPRSFSPSHCTGDPVREAFKEAYKEDFIEYGVIKIIEIKSDC